MLDRKSKLLHCIQPATSKGLEIGALCRPFITAADGPVAYVDHASTADLQAKYANDPAVDCAAIVQVDYVWGANTLPEAVGADRFDYVLASHVIEHVPNLIGWLKEIHTVLQPGGVLTLVVPDKRFTFDCRRNVTNFAQLVEAHLEGWRRPSMRQALEHVSEVTVVPHQQLLALWEGADPAEVPLAHPEMVAQFSPEWLAQRHREIQSGHYFDVHCTVFTPHSFLQLLAALARAGFLDFRVASFFDTDPGQIEFFVALEALPLDRPASQRLEATLASLAAIQGPFNGPPLSGTRQR